VKHLSEMERFRAQELLERRATVGLEPHEEDELAALGVADDESFDLAAASISLASLEIEPMPAHLSNQLMMSVSGSDIAGGDGFGETSDTTVMPVMHLGVPETLAGFIPPRPIVTGQQPLQPAPVVVPALQWQPHPASAGMPPRELTLPPQRAPQPNVVSLDAARLRRRARVATVLAVLGMAAAAAVAVFFVTRPPVEKIKEVVVEVPAPVTKEPTPVEARAALLQDAKDATTVAWSATEDPNAKGASGDVVWSSEKHTGFMRIAGLAVNDATQLQYQLWIFDADRPEATPVDGGVFDISVTGEVIVPIDAKISVGKPVLFAVTVEKPGGVVVSKRERIVLAAKVAG
jgi:hypothetical protein